MECGCKQETKQLILEGEFGADPIWCAKCQYNIELDEMPLSDELKDELLDWANSFGQWADLETSQFIEGGETLEVAHNERGKRLAQVVQEALGKGYSVQFVASAM